MGRGTPEDDGPPWTRPLGSYVRGGGHGARGGGHGARGGAHGDRGGGHGDAPSVCEVDMSCLVKSKLMPKTVGQLVENSL